MRVKVNKLIFLGFVEDFFIFARRAVDSFRFLFLMIAAAVVFLSTCSVKF